MAKVTHLRTDQQRKDAYLSEMSDEEIVCRAGHRHRFPTDELSPRAKKLPGQVSVTATRGVYQIEEHCLRGCGRIRTFSSVNGIFGLDTVYAYKQAAGTTHVTIPEDSGVTLTSRDYKSELFERSGMPALLRAAARQVS
jgi:hypothetical protein